MFNLFAIFKRERKTVPEDRVRDFEFETIMENIRDGVVIYDTGFRILSMNRAAMKIAGLNEVEIIGKIVEPGMLKDARLRTITQIIFPSFAPAMTTISAGGWPQIIDLSLEEPRMELRTVLTRITNAGGETAGFMKIITDMTREKGVMESKSEFISVAAHQLRTPLTALNWSFESLNKLLAEKDPNMKEAADLVKEGWQLTERSLKIVNDLLNAARIEEGRFGFKFKEIDLIDFLRTAMSQAEPIAKEYGIKLTLNAGKNAVLVKIDPEMMGIALANVLDNGIKYNTKDGEVSVETENDPANPEFVKIKIRDTGVGMQKEDTAKIFQKFYRGTNIAQIAPNGSGLGLYITKNIIESHGGKINAESQPGRGTTFSITLPIVAGAQK